MLFYWIIFFVLLLLALVKGKKNHVWVFVILLVMGATRARTVGNDLNGGYWSEYVSMGTSPNTWGKVLPQFEVGFQWIMANFKEYIDIFNYPLLFFHVLFAITFINITIYCKRHTNHLALVFFFMYALAYYFSMYNIMRQMFCDSIILLWMTYYLQIKKPKLLLFVVLTIITCFLFHKSQIVLLIVVPLFFIYKKISHLWLYVGLILSMVLSMTLAKFAFEYLNLLAPYVDDGSSNMSRYMVGKKDFGQYSVLSVLLNTLFCIYCVFSNRHEKSYYLVLYVLGVICLNILTPISWIFSRVAEVFMFFRIFVYADLWYHVKNKKERLLFRFAVLLLSLVMFNNRLVKDHKFPDVVPYVNEYVKF